MKTPLSLIVERIGLIALGVLCPGCSLLGLAVDASIQPDTLAADPGDKALEGKNVLLTLRDGFSFSGECRRQGSLPGELYRSRYARWRKTGGRTIFPVSPNDTLHIAWGQGQIAVGSLEGFTRSSIIVLPICAASPLPHRQLQCLSIPVEKLDSLRTMNGTALDCRMLRARLNDRSVPTTDAMLVRRAENSAWVPLDDIVRIREIRYSYHWFSTGAMADVAGLVTVVILFAIRGN